MTMVLQSSILYINYYVSPSLVEKGSYETTTVSQSVGQPVMTFSQKWLKRFL